ncbi:MAG: aldo/keto reductase [Spirochaetes bacterium]|nr:aldo/keto reductase [Spirochaetota bacterium]
MVPPVIFGTSYLGNLYKELTAEQKAGIVKSWFDNVEAPVAADSAGKYGAGLALEVMGSMLAKMGIAQDDIVISNKLGWYRVPLKGAEPTFEPGAWANLKYDAVQKISYDGIVACFEQGCSLLGTYRPALISVHDPDEYLSAGTDDKDRVKRYADILGAYKALHEIKRSGKAKAVGVGSKDWKIIRRLSDDVALDWVMLACSFTIMQHDKELVSFLESLVKRGVGIINSAVFHAGFLTGGEYFDYRKPNPNNADDRKLFVWREKFMSICKAHAVEPSHACMQFGMSLPGIAALALNTSNPAKTPDNVRAVGTKLPNEFWRAMKDGGLIDKAYPYAG